MHGSGILKLCGFILQVASIISIIKLIRMGIDIDFFEPLKKVVSWYTWFIDNTVGLLLNDSIVSAIAWVNSWLKLDVHLFEHWKYMFTPMVLYFLADVLVMLRHYRRVANALFSFVWGGGVALISSVIAGTSPLDAAGVPTLLYPALGFTVYVFVQCLYDVLFYTQEGVSRKSRFKHFMICYPALNLLFLSVLFYANSAITRAGYRISSVILILVFVSLMCIRNISVAALAAFIDRSTGATWWQRFLRYGTRAQGVRVLTVVLAAVLASICGAAAGP
jgi:hypothetical protein